MKISLAHLGSPRLPKLLAWACALVLSACASAPQISAPQRLQQAEKSLQGWKSRWSPSGRPAEGQDAEGASQAREELLDLRKTSEESIEVDRERLSFLLAESQFACGDFKAACAEYRQLLENFPLTEKRPDAEKAIYQIAVQWSQRNESFLGTGLFSDQDRAIEALNYIVDYAPRSPFADDALRLIGIIRFQQSDFEEAIASFERILQGYPESIWADFAEYHIGLCYLRRVRSPRADRDGLLQAEERFRDYLRRRAEGSFREQAIAALGETTEKLAESEYEIGEFYRRIGQSFGARYHWEQTIKKYPSTRFAPMASQALAKLSPPQESKP